MRKTLAIGLLVLCVALSGCGTISGWFAGKALQPSQGLQIDTQLGQRKIQAGDEVNVKENKGMIAGHSYHEINNAHHVKIIDIPWWIILLLMFGWPLILTIFHFVLQCKLFSSKKNRW